MDYNILTIPLYFVRSGNINNNNGRLWNPSGNGYDWSSVATSQHSSGSITPSAYYLSFNVDIVGSSGGPYSCWNGYPLCCLVCGGGILPNVNRC